MRLIVTVIAAVLAVIFALPAAAEQPKDFSVRLSVVKKSPTTNLLVWQKDANTIRYRLYLKPLNGQAWQEIPMPDSVANEYEFPADAVAAEFMVQRYFSPGTLKTIQTNVAADTIRQMVATGYAVVGAGNTVPDRRGTILLVIDSLIGTRISAKLDRLEQDLRSEWWNVVRARVPRAEDFSPAAVKKTKAVISQAYQAEGENLKAVFLIGRVAVPYSTTGSFSGGRLIPPDGHFPDHSGAWAADSYYGDMDENLWTDDQVNVTSASRPINHNIPGDGKFDQTTIPSHLEFAIGRADFYNMPVFRDTAKHKTLFDTEISLLERYFDKNHAYRSGGSHAVPRRTLIDDNFGSYTPEMFGSSGWRLASVSEKDSVRAGKALTELKANPYMWFYGCGGGSYTSCGGVGISQNFADQPVNAVFTMLFGSYFGDWDNADNIMRSMIAADGLTLTCAWSARPHWYFHRMGAGMTTGDAFLMSINTLPSPLYYPNVYFTKNYPDGIIYQGSGRGVHVALLGDPTLQMAMGGIPAGTKLTVSQPGTYTRLQWQPAGDTAVGYVIYRADSAGNRTLVTQEPLWKTTTYNDSNVVRGTYRYAVHNVKRRISPSGSYYDANGIPAETEFTVTGADEEPPVAPAFTVECSPLPVKTSASFRLTLPCASALSLLISDVSGSEVYRLELPYAPAGEREIIWKLGANEGARVAAGVYSATVSGCGTTVSRTIVVVSE